MACDLDSSIYFSYTFFLFLLLNYILKMPSDTYNFFIFINNFVIS